MPLVTVRKPQPRPPGRNRKAGARDMPYQRGGTLDANPIGHPPSDTWSLDFHRPAAVDWSLLDSDDRWGDGQ